MGSSTLYGNNISFFYKNLLNIKLDCVRKMHRMINVNVIPWLLNLHHVRACINLWNIKVSVVTVRKSYKIINNNYQNEFRRI
jgi:hypothetical protein